MVKALAKLHFVANEILLCKILYFVRGTELLAEKKMMTQNRSENGGSALCAHPTHTDT
jgi:hypothetical protein